MKKFTMYIGRYSCSCCSNDSKRQVCTNDQDYAIRNAKRHHYHHQWCPYVSQLCETFQNEEEAYRNCVLSWEKNGLHYFTYTNSTRIYYDNTKNLFEVSFFFSHLWLFVSELNKNQLCTYNDYKIIVCKTCECHLFSYQTRV